MSDEPAKEIITTEEANIYDYWKVLVKRKTIFLCVLIIPLAIVTILALFTPQYYRGESEILLAKLPASDIPSVITAPNIINLVGEIDDVRKAKIFANHSGAIKNVIISMPQKSINRISITIESKSPAIIPQAIKDVFNYINALPQIMEETARIQQKDDLKTQRTLEEIDFKIMKLREAKEANIDFLKDMSDMLKKRKLAVVNFNPSDLVRKDGDIALEITNLQDTKKDILRGKELNAKGTIGILVPPSIAKRPSREQTTQLIIVTGILSIIMSIFIVLFLEYVEKMKARKRLSEEASLVNKDNRELN